MKKLKLIWDFHGPDARKTAEHHEVHLKEFIENKSLPLDITGVEEVSESHFTAFLVVYEKDMISVRDTLRPHRGEWFQPDMC